MSKKQRTKVRRAPVHMKPEDVEYVLSEMEAWNRGERGRKFTWELLERIAGVTRQTLSSKPEIAAKYEVVKAALRNGVPARNPAGPEIERLRAQVQRLQRDAAEKEAQIAAWQELWMRYEYNATVQGIDAERLRMPLPPKAIDKST